MLAREYAETIASNFKNIRAAAASTATDLARTIKRKDWNFVHLYHWEPPKLDEIDVLSARRQVPVDDFSLTKNLITLPTGSPVVFGGTLHSTIHETLYLPEPLPSWKSLATASDRAIVFSAATTGSSFGVDTTREATPVAQAQRNARFAIVEGSKSLADLTPITGHIVRLHDGISGEALEQVMDKIDRFIQSFSEPSSWAHQALATRVAVLQIRNKKEEVVVFVNLSASARQGRIVSSVMRTAGASEQEQKRFSQRVQAVLKVLSEQRVYVAGDALRSLDLDELSRAEGIELIHRNLSYRRSLGATEQGLLTLQDKKIDPTKVAFVNGLPSTNEAVDTLGPFAGDAQQWLEFRSNVETATKHVSRNVISAKEEFFRELREGQSDVLILVAHADGNTVYLDGQAVTLAELQQLRRTKASTRPRLAILLSCNAGTETTSIPAWRRWFFSQRQSLSLANILVGNGLVDRVIAPNRTINAKETVSTLQSLLHGVSTNSKNLRQGFVNWASILRPLGYDYET